VNASLIQFPTFAPFSQSSTEHGLTSSHTYYLTAVLGVVCLIYSACTLRHAGCVSLSKRSGAATTPSRVHLSCHRLVHVLPQSTVVTLPVLPGFRPESARCEGGTASHSPQLYFLTHIALRAPDAFLVWVYPWGSACEHHKAVRPTSGKARYQSFFCL
jgi:hypothetical protein